MFTGGNYIHGTWTRKDRTAPFTLTDDSGDVIQLTPGRTFIELPRDGKTTRDAFRPLFDRYGVDLVLCGHDHDYERSYPVRGYNANAGVDATTLSRNLQILEKRGLVRGFGRGRAGKRLELTSTGLSLMEKAVPLWRQARTEVVAALGENGLRSANRAMRVLANAASLKE